MTASIPFAGYPPVYHKACAHLVAYGGHGGNTRAGRKLVADALRALRARYGREFARDARGGLLFISGQFPVKVKPQYCPACGEKVYPYHVTRNNPRAVVAVSIPCRCEETR